jgi:GGDEF domain-containing protein
MISIRESMSELEKSDRLRALAQDCYLTVIKNLAQYVIELEEGITADYRNNLAAVAKEVETGTAKAISESRARLRGLLRDYRDKATTYLKELREELSGTANGLQRLVDTLALSDGDHESRLRQALKTLRELAQDPTAGVIAPPLRAATESIEQSLEQFRQQQELTVSQFLAEIDLLHKRINALESAVSADDLTKLFDRSDIESRIRSASTGGSLLLLRAQGFERAAVQFSRDVANQLAAAFVKRLRKYLIPGSIVGCWSAEQYLVFTQAAKNEAVAGAKWVTEHLSGAYACLQGGKTVRPTVQVNVAVLEFASGEPAERTLQKISQFFSK